MPTLTQTSDILLRFLKARVPLIILRSDERGRAMDVLSSVGAQLRSMPFYVHSRTTGLQDLASGAAISDDRSLPGALEYATQTFSSRENANFVFTDVEDVDGESSTARHFAEIARLAENRGGSMVLIVATPVWPGLARLGMTVSLDLPTEEELHEVISALVDDHRTVMPVEWGQEEVRRAAETLVGVTQTEAINITTTLLAKGSLTLDDVSEISHFKDQIFGDLNGIETVKLLDDQYQIGGLTTLRNWLQRKNELIKADLRGTPLHPPKGVLLVGVPGCGKSLSAKAIAMEWKLPLYRLDMASVLGMYVGESERQLREALEAADRIAPCVLWIDEIEKGLAGSRGDSGTSRRLVGQFLFWLQESTSKVFLVATANDVASLPPELLRKGRFDEIFFVDLPDEDDRAEIIRLYFDKYLKNSPSSSLVEELVVLSEGFAGSDLEAVIHDIATEMFMHRTTTLPAEEYIKKVFGNVVPFSRTNPEEVAAIRAWGRERAVPAGREHREQEFVGVHTGRRVVVMD